MNPQESTLIQQLIESQKEHQEESLKFQKQMTDKMDKVMRGVYGDPENGVHGLIQRQTADEGRISKLEIFNKKLVWVWGLITGSVFIVWEMFREDIKKRFL